jgi:hypothetical protein
MAKIYGIKLRGNASVGQSCRIDGIPDIYVVRGYDPSSKQYWLAVVGEGYEGYDGDVIICEHGDETYHTALIDSRTSIKRGIVKLIAAQ